MPLAPQLSVPHLGQLSLTSPKIRSISPNSIGHDHHQHRRLSPNNIVVGGRQSISPPLSNGTSTTMPPDLGSPGRSLSPLSL
ncbi:hypothetical protein BLA29_007083, partial [Euroglyphus maynei]